MAKKSSPLLEKVSTLLKSSIFIAKMRGQIIQRLLFLRRSKRVKKLMFRKHYNYRYIQEYEFSPSKNTPLMQYYYRKPIKKRSCYEDMYSMFFVCKCLGILRCEDEDKKYSMDLMPLPSIEDRRGLYEVSDLCNEDEDDEDESVDEKAEKFIEKFYEEMRRQRQETIMLVN